MGTVTFQTIKLSSGKHRSPEEGACVMELASMLAGEKFSDRPDCVCPVIGSFLRAYNDSIDDRRRQDLYAYAAKVVGSRGTHRTERARIERLAEWARAVTRSPWTRMWLRLRPLDRMRRIELIGSYTVHAIPKHTDRSHAAALSLIDELLRIGANGRWETAPAGRYELPVATR